MTESPTFGVPDAQPAAETPEQAPAPAAAAPRLPAPVRDRPRKAPLSEASLEVEAGATLTKAEVLPVVAALQPHVERCIRDHGEPLPEPEGGPLRFRMHIRGEERGTRVERLTLQGGRSPSPYLDACFVDVAEEVPLPGLNATGEATVSSPLPSAAP